MNVFRPMHQANKCPECVIGMLMLREINSLFPFRITVECLDCGSIYTIAQGKALKMNAEDDIVSIQEVEA